MSITEKQKAYHLQKMRTRMTRLDINKDGYISRDDYELMSKKLSEHSGMTKKQAESVYKEFMRVADSLNLKPGLKIPLKEAAQNASKVILSMEPKERKTKLHANHGMLFDAIDTNKDGHISQEEFKIYFQVIAPDISEAEVAHSFETIDANKNGEISREEFVTAAEDFMCGVEETDLSKVFFGHLLD